MKPIKISFQGIMDAFGMVIMVTLSGIMALLMGALLWGLYDSSWLWKIPLVVVGSLILVAAVGIFGWVYEKNPTINFGGRKIKLPKAKVVH